VDASGAFLIAARLVHFVGAIVLFGAAVFPVYGFGPLGPPEGFARVLKGVLVAAAVIALTGALAVLSATAANMAGSLPAAFDADTLQTVLAGTVFGRVWAVRLLIAAALLALALTLGDTGRRRFLPTLAGLFLASVALTGHARLQHGPQGWFHMAVDAGHLLAAGAWLGALVPLIWLASARPESEATGEAMLRFSGIGYLSVATLVFTGVINVWMILGPPWKLFDTAYGRLLSVKLVLFLFMLALAAVNRTRLTPRLVGVAGRPVVRRPETIARLRRNVLAETALGLLVVAVVAALGTLDPSV
jgi:putative copper resistance protein D